VSNRSKSDSPTNTRPKREGQAGNPERADKIKSRMKSAASLLKVSCGTPVELPACRAAQALKVSTDAVEKSRGQFDYGQEAAEL
jgi:hypothetical protein